jgi:esterase/lipase superfamily enzyme
MPTTVYFASNRVLTGPADQVGSYGPGIQPPSLPQAMTYGTAFVDGIDLTTNAQGVVTSIASTAQGGFPADAGDDLANPGRNLLVFIHGFDNTFSDAITRAAFNREWMAASGVPAADTTVIAFSWPSLGQIFGIPILQSDYLHDQNMARLSGIHLMAFFANLERFLIAARAARRRTFLLAHSMGHLALQSAVENWFLHGNGRAELFDQAILAAGDCRDNAFAQPDLAGLSGLGLLASRVAIYFSHNDHVLQLSAAVNGGAQRLGQDGPPQRTDPARFPPSVYRMADASEDQDYDFNFLTSHQYYRQSPKARLDIAHGMDG